MRTSGNTWTRVLRGLVVTLAVGLVTVGVSKRELVAQNDEQSGRECGNGSLRGGYGFLVSGYKPVPPPGSGLERFNATGVYNFDGNGTFTFEGGALQGEITGLNPDPTNPVGEYEVLPNCTGTMSWYPAGQGAPLFLRFAIVVVDKGKQVKLGGSTGLSQGEAIRK